MGCCSCSSRSSSRWGRGARGTRARIRGGRAQRRRARPHAAAASAPRAAAAAAAHAPSRGTLALAGVAARSAAPVRRRMLWGARRAPYVPLLLPHRSRARPGRRRSPPPLAPAPPASPPAVRLGCGVLPAAGRVLQQCHQHHKGAAGRPAGCWAARWRGARGQPTDRRWRPQAQRRGAHGLHLRAGSSRLTDLTPRRAAFDTASDQVNFFAREEHDSLPNYKLLQAGLTSLNITRDINVQKLLRGSKVDTLELMQYLYKFLKRETGGEVVAAGWRLEGWSRRWACSPVRRPTAVKAAAASKVAAKCARPRRP
jgi:hypothetical protein